MNLIELQNLRSYNDNLEMMKVSKSGKDLYHLVEKIAYHLHLSRSKLGLIAERNWSDAQISLADFCLDKPAYDIRMELPTPRIKLSNGGLKEYLKQEAYRLS